MKKLALVFAVLVLGCSAFASSYTFGFLSSGGSTLYCNYEQLNNSSSTGTWAYGGDDNFSACGISHNAAVSGFGLVNGPSGTSGIPVKVTKGVIYGDEAYDVEFGTVSYDQWTVATNLKASSKKWGWIGVAGAISTGGVFGDNYGYLTTSIPGPKTPHAGPSMGSK